MPTIFTWNHRLTIAQPLMKRRGLISPALTCDCRARGCLLVQVSTEADSSTSGAGASDVSSPAEEQRPGLLPGLSQEADREKEGDLLPKASDLDFKEEVATLEVGQ